MLKVLKLSRLALALGVLCPLISVCLLSSKASAQTSVQTLEAKLEKRLDRLIGEMTLEQKVGQMNLRGRGSSRSNDAIPAELEEAVRSGQTGALINIMNPADVDRLQRMAVEEAPHGIPLLFGRDVIHGFRTIFPIPLGQAASWDPDLVEKATHISAKEASAFGVNWAFAPMLDITRDPRWGRIAESPGEDPYLASVLAVAMVRGLQGDDLSQPTSLAACIKHFAGYGGAEGGRDYNTVLLSDDQLENVFLPPFKAAVDTGAASVMTGFHELNGIPASGHVDLLRSTLQQNWGFSGFTVSDWNSIAEMIAHGFSADESQAATQAVRAGVDLEMMSETYANSLVDLVQAGKVPEAEVDEAVRRLLRIKAQLGLFETPYRRTEEPLLSADSLEVARAAAAGGVVLLTNEANRLPLSKDLSSVAVIGPLADAPREQLGTWIFDGRVEDSRTPLAALREQLGDDRVHHAPGLTHSRDRSQAGFEEALTAARRSEVVLFFAGEEAILSGEAHSRANIDLPGAQVELVHQLAELGKPVVLVILAGRPITLLNVIDQVDAVLMAWHPGTMAGPALADLLLGDREPSGRLPVTWPKSVGQIPIYYNHKMTGRPPEPERWVEFDEIPVGAWQSSLSNTSHYLDLGFEPHFPFGYGMTYTTFEYSEPTVQEEAGRVVVTARIRNTGTRQGVEVAQLYVRDLVGSLTRPVRELKGFERVALAPGASRVVRFELDESSLAFHGPEGFKSESGDFEVWIAPNASEGVPARFTWQAPRPTVGYIERLSPAINSLIPSDAEIEVLAQGFDWSEGPVWVQEGEFLLFSDVPQNTIYRWREDDGVETWLKPSGFTGTGEPTREPGSNGLLLDQEGHLVLCQHGDRRLARLREDLERRPGTAAQFETLAATYSGKRFNSPNDVVQHSSGAFYFTDPPYGLNEGESDPAREIDAFGVYRVSSDQTVTQVSDEMTRPNGLAFSPDESILYVANSDPQKALWMAYPVRPAGDLGSGRVFFDATTWVDDKPGLPDGLKVSVSGHLFATGPGGVLVFSPAGEHLGTIVTERATANCAFGDDGSTLYITADDLLLRVRLSTVGS